MITLNPSTLLNGSGFDVSSLITQALAPENAQLQVREQQQTDLQNQSSLLTNINSDLGSLSSAVNSLTDILGPLLSQTASSSQPSIVTASAQASATPGTHTIVVSTLATQGTVYTNPLADGNTSILPSNAQTADLQIQVGGTGGATHDIAITAGSNDTLNKIAAYINSQNWGVSATVLSDATGARLAIYSQSTGSTGALSVVNNTTAVSFNPPIGGANATFTVDGIPFSSTTNTVGGAVPGVTLNLLGAYPSIQAQLTVGADTNAATQGVNNFVTAYNSVIRDINQQFTIDPTTNSEGPLGSDSSLRVLQSNLLSAATYSLGSGTYQTLASIGIKMNDDGTLTVNSSQLSSALASNPTAVTAFFQNAGGAGFANNFSSNLQKLTDSVDGLLNIDLSENQQRQLDLANSVLDFQDRMNAQKQALSTQFSQANALLQEFPFLMQSIDLQLGIQTNPSSNRVP